MSTYTVYEPPQRDPDMLRHADRFVFLRDGFSWSAFFFGPLWMLRHRLWLAALLYVIFVAGIAAGLRAAGASNALTLIVFLLGLLIGLEASSLRHAKLERRGWKNVGVVVGDSIETAERRFFNGWVSSDIGHRTPAAPSDHLRGMSSVSPDVIGLFPEPGARA
ncbi:MAG TPA: DUF2628 domain-containing protein [Xanthobacteraceae bacterium]|jgi:hypothetical protein|nr:DUF2628 domain-containing protein [Xanthobacteraceae bacterium]